MPCAPRVTVLAPCCVAAQRTQQMQPRAAAITSPRHRWSSRPPGLQERERVAFLTAELERVTTERDELQRGSAFAGGDEEGEVLGVMFEGDEAGEAGGGEAGEGEEHDGEAGGEDDWVETADGLQQWGGEEVGEPESWVADGSSATAATRLAAGGAGGEPSNRTPSCHVV